MFLILRIRILGTSIGHIQEVSNKYPNIDTACMSQNSCSIYSRNQHKGCQNGPQALTTTDVVAGYVAYVGCWFFLTVSFHK